VPFAGEVETCARPTVQVALTRGRAFAPGLLPGLAHAGLPGLFAIGPLRRGELWESTAVPEIRLQALALAPLLAAGRPLATVGGER
jgi:hypothetical protein